MDVGALPRLLSRGRTLLAVTIWQASTLEDRSWRGRVYRLLRVADTCWRGFTRTNIGSRAGALSFGTLVGMAPLLAISISVSGFILGQDQGLAVEWLTRLLSFIAPQADQFGRAGEMSAALNPELVRLLENIIERSQSGAVGVVGFLLLVVVVIQLFTQVETTFNEIWGVGRGRPWASRVVIYWSVLTLGTLLAFASLTLISVSAVVNLFETFRLGAVARSVLAWSAPGVSFWLLVLVLSAFYRFTPHAPVQWKAAVFGAAIVALLLIANHYSAFLYVNRVVLEQNFYGQLGILLVLMAGLYIFWFFLLLGGLLAYAVQNADYLCRDPSWEALSHRARESFTLLVFLRVARRFRACQPPASVRELGALLHLPHVVVVQCLQRLRDLGWVTLIEANDEDDMRDLRAQPARPLDRLTLGDFREAFATLGTTGGDRTLADLDPLLRRYLQEGDAAVQAETARLPLDRLLGEPPLTALPAGADRPKAGHDALTGG